MCEARLALLNESAFSESRVASRISGTPYWRVSACTAVRFASENGWPPAMLHARLLPHECDAVVGRAQHRLERRDVDVALERER